MTEPAGGRGSRDGGAGRPVPLAPADGAAAAASAPGAPAPSGTTVAVAGRLRHLGEVTGAAGSGAAVSGACRLRVRGGGDVAIDEVRVSDVLVVGTGVAGLAAALGCSPRAVTVITKTRLGAGGSSAWAQGGVAAAVGPDDSPALHAADTVAVAGGLADPAAVELLTREGPVRLAELIRLGTRFDRNGGGSGLAGFALGREAAHSRRRILHAGGDATGAELVRALTAAVRVAPGVRVDEETFAIDLVVEEVVRTAGRPGRGEGPRSGRAPWRPTGGRPEGGDDPRGDLPPCRTDLDPEPERSARVAGVLALDPDGRRVLYLAGATVLATGGLGQLYLHTTNPPEVTGDGLAMAARAGACLADLEFVQFHPTALAVGHDGDRLPLLTEALRGEGAVLVDEAGRRFMPAEHPLAELAPRDIVARAIHRRLAAGGLVFLDARGVAGEGIAERFPTVFAAARDAGLDPRRDLLPVVPAAHYHMGGVATDDRGRTTLPGLWACGETAATGVHGANRLASNSLLEALVFGGRVADDLARRPAPVPGTAGEDLRRLAACTVAEAGGVGGAVRRAAGLTGRGGPGGGRFRGDHPPWGPIGDAAACGPVETPRETIRHRLRDAMWRHVGLVRDASSLARAAAAITRLEGDLAPLLRRVSGVSPAALRSLLETRNLLTAGRLVVAAAAARAESRGAHHREDHPAADPAWARRLLVTLGADGRPAPRLADRLAGAMPAPPERPRLSAGAVR